MRKKLDDEELTETNGPMNAVAQDDARAYLGLDNRSELTPVEQRMLRAKKKKIVTSSKKLDRQIDRELTRRANRLE
jgi:predicted lipase